MQIKRLYLGTDAPDGCLHYPVIRVVPLKIPTHIMDDFPDYTHVLFTSKNAVTILLTIADLKQKQLIAIGQSTAAKLTQEGYPPQFIAKQESQEGVIALLRTLDLSRAYIFYPRSSLARKNLENFMIEGHIRHQVCDLYETVFQSPDPMPDLADIDEIIFSSPSTVKGFIAAFGSIPPGKKLTCIGPITEEELRRCLIEP